MTLYSKIIFFILIFISYFLTNVLSRTNETKALQKIIILFFTSLMFLGIMFPEQIIIGLAKITGVGRGPDALLYLFIIVTLSIIFAIMKKIILLEYKLNKVIQHLSSKELNNDN